MSADRPVDLCVFGATGFTGQFVVKEAIRVAAKYGFHVALAARDKKKVEGVERKIRQELGSVGADVTTSIIIADISDRASLVAMARMSRVVIDCVGPFRFYGEAVVSACIEGGADMVDITGEPEYMERMELEYHDRAVKAGVVIVPSCGFDSIPADVGVRFAIDTGAKNGLLVTDVESYLTMQWGPAGFGAHFATWESAIYGFANADKLRGIRKAYTARYPEIASLPVYGAYLPRRGSFFWSSELAAWALPFPGSDAAVVRRTQRYEWQHRDDGSNDDSTAAPSSASSANVKSSDESVAPSIPVQYGAYFTVPTTYALMWMIIYGAFFALFARCACGRKILLKYPQLFSSGVFSHEGPSQEQMRDSRFIMRFTARGYPISSLPTLGGLGGLLQQSKKSKSSKEAKNGSSSSSGGGSSSNSSSNAVAVVEDDESSSLVNASKAAKAPPPPTVACEVEVRGPEPGYVSCAAMVTSAALTLLLEKENLPGAKRGGVLTPAAAFRGSKILERMREGGVEFVCTSTPHPIATAGAASSSASESSVTPSSFAANSSSSSRKLKD